MPSKPCNSELLIRIDERVGYMATRQDKMSVKIDAIIKINSDTDKRVALIEAEHKKIWHTGLLGIIMKIFVKP